MINDDIQRAIDTGAIIEIAYTKYDGTASIRRLSDVQYSDEYGNTHIQAFCHKRNEQRTFKISRISRVTFINSPEAAADQSVLINPTNVKMPYRFDRSKKVFELYGFDYNN
jgi:predicted DNA-binding transcriptional regulator YafY